MASLWLVDSDDFVLHVVILGMTPDTGLEQNSRQPITACIVRQSRDGLLRGSRGCSLARL